ncbi:ejaculatory bulb-specific protein 3-like [Aethina tumida]|uniref:ejaculatory bulb-specific protein 3-like n=1 Tax=Aethina tumida TaxID=116153 RepID=UPI002149939A|nr:ejaculatory bulb-specific protein 3-like [Aethina tumida]
MLGKLVICLVIAGVVLAEKYTTKYDNIDYNEIISSERLLKNYVNCLMERGPCSPDGAELKRVLPDALETECSKCSDVQRNGVKKVVAHLIKNKQDMWEDLQKKYDPEGKYMVKYQEQLKADGLL